MGAPAPQREHDMVAGLPPTSSAAKSLPGRMTAPFHGPVADDGVRSPPSENQEPRRRGGGRGLARARGRSGSPSPSPVRRRDAGRDASGAGSITSPRAARRNSAFRPVTRQTQSCFADVGMFPAPRVYQQVARAHLSRSLRASSARSAKEASPVAARLTASCSLAR